MWLAHHKKLCGQRFELELVQIGSLLGGGVPSPPYHDWYKAVSCEIPMSDPSPQTIRILHPAQHQYHHRQYPHHNGHPNTGWQPFGEGKNAHKNFRQAHICYSRDKCVFFVRYCNFANLIQYNMHVYHVMNNNALAQKNCCCPKKNTFLSPSLPKSA